MIRDRFQDFPKMSIELPPQMLTVNPQKRIKSDEALKHPWICVSQSSYIQDDYGQISSPTVKVLENLRVSM